MLPRALEPLVPRPAVFPFEPSPRPTRVLSVFAPGAGRKWCTLRTGSRWAISAVAFFAAGAARFEGLSVVVAVAVSATSEVEASAGEATFGVFLVSDAAWGSFPATSALGAFTPAPPLQTFPAPTLRTFTPPPRPPPWELSPRRVSPSVPPHQCPRPSCGSWGRPQPPSFPQPLVNLLNLHQVGDGVNVPTVLRGVFTDDRLADSLQTKTA